MGLILYQFLLVGIGGFFGANARYLLSIWVTTRLSEISGRQLPYERWSLM
jgi:fluoride ion exporter CrcB/FEX